MHRTASRLAALGSFMFLVLAGASASAAPDAHAVADALVAAFGAPGKVVASYADATASGDAITITGFKVVQPKRTGRELTVASIVIVGAAERQPGGYTAASMTLSDGVTSYRHRAVTWQTAVVDNVVIPTADEARSLSKAFLPFASASVSGIAIDGPEFAQPIDVPKIDISMTANANGEPNGATISAKDIHVPASAFSAPEVQGTMQGLGYTDLVISADFDMAFDTNADTLTLRALDVDIADVGKLSITGAFSNVKVHGLVGSGADGKPAPRQAPSLGALSIRFDNSGVIERALDMQAEIIGTTREDMANQWPMLFMLIVGGAGDMAFEEKLQTDLTTFLQSPKSITVTLAPPTPVPLDQVAHSFNGDRTNLPETLGVDISVNK